MKLLFAAAERAWNSAKAAGLLEWELVQFSRDRALAMGRKEEASGGRVSLLGAARTDR